MGEVLGQIGGAKKEIGEENQDDDAGCKLENPSRPTGRFDPDSVGWVTLETLALSLNSKPFSAYPAGLLDLTPVLLHDTLNGCFVSLMKAVFLLTALIVRESFPGIEIGVVSRIEI
jgi:hypothetical protein